jgi:hypothetical protein
MDTPDYGFSRPFKGKGALSNGLKGIKNVLVKRYFIFHCISTFILSRTSRRVCNLFTAILYKSVKHNHIYLYLSINTLFGLQTPSSGRHY